MRKVIGIASEGPTDFQVLKTAINKITGEDNIFRALQPEPDMLGHYGNGWKGVWRWCKETTSLDLIMNGISPQLDLVIIQMDGDVIRKEREVHCVCESTVCEDKGKYFPLYCNRALEKCPITLPCKNHEQTPSGNREHGASIIQEALHGENLEKVLITIPCDSTDAWVVAAYDEYSNLECLEDPWKNIIAKGKYYHGVRVRGNKKNAHTYGEFMETLAENWNSVTNRCESAKIFEQEIRKFFLQGCDEQ